MKEYHLTLDYNVSGQGTQQCLAMGKVLQLSMGAESGQLGTVEF